GEINKRGTIVRIAIGKRGLALLIVCISCAGLSFAQAPPSSIQIFMPNGAMPSHAIQLVIVSDRGQTDNVFTDSKGVYQMRTPTTLSMSYTLTIESDRQTYDTTVTTFRLDRNTPARIPVFLKALPPEKRPTGSSAVLDVANFEGNVPTKARAAYKRGIEFVNSGQFEQAIPQFHQAISLYPKYVRAINDLGATFM